MQKCKLIILIAFLIGLCSFFGCSVFMSESGGESGSGSVKETCKLEYTLNDDGKSYAVVGLEEFAGETLVIPEKNKGLPITKISKSAFLNVSDFSKVVISKNVKEVDAHAFQGCKALKEVEFKNGAETIGDRAFRWCSALESVTLPSSLKTIGLEAFTECKSLKEICIPNNVKKLGNAVFKSCEQLKKAVVGNSVAEISEDCFSQCVSLTDITIGESVATIRRYSFASCNSLVKVTIPDNVKTVGDHAFYSCENLETVVLGKGITRLLSVAFDNLKLKNVYYKGTAEMWNAIEFQGTHVRLKAAKLYYYSEAQPSTSGNYWCYKNGEIFVW